MPVQEIKKKGRTIGYRWGTSGKTYKISELGKQGAYEKARKQGMAIKISQLRRIKIRGHSRQLKSKRTLVKTHTRIIKRPTYKQYKKIYERARKKGYKIPQWNLQKGPLVTDEVNIPENFTTDAWIIPDPSDKKKNLILIDDDAPKTHQKKAFAHELGHVHMFQKNIKPHTEKKADKIGANILEMPLKKFMDPDVTNEDVLTQLKSKKRPTKTGSFWETKKFRHGPRIKQPKEFKKIYLVSPEWIKKRKKQIKNYEMMKRMPENAKIKVGTLKKNGLAIQSFIKKKNG